ncbi:hypothetical protein L1I79_38020 [Strepomyces sp. STD 3.1]|nr:hypothetical protein [Streptomyces sp. STD 3.1]
MALLAGVFMTATVGTATAVGPWTPYNYQSYTSKGACNVQATVLNLKAISSGLDVEYTCFENAYTNPTVWGLYWRTK